MQFFAQSQHFRYTWRGCFSHKDYFQGATFFTHTSLSYSSVPFTSGNGLPINHFTKQTSTPRSISESSTQLFSLFSPTIRLGSITHEFLFQQLGYCLAYYNFLSLQHSSSANTTETPPPLNITDNDNEIQHPPRSTYFSTELSPTTWSTISATGSLPSSMFRHVPSWFLLHGEISTPTISVFKGSILHIPQDKFNRFSIYNIADLTFIYNFFPSQYTNP